MGTRSRSYQASHRKQILRQKTAEKITCEVQSVERGADGLLSVSKDVEGRGRNIAYMWEMVREYPLSKVTKCLFGHCQEQLMETPMEEHADKNFSVKKLEK